MMKKFLAAFLAAFWLLTQAVQAEFIVNELQGFNVGTAQVAAPPFSYRTTVSSTVDLAPGADRTFATTDIGTADASRIVVAVAFMNGILTANQTMTIGGVSATKTGAAASGGLEIWRAAVPTGTTADIVFHNGDGSVTSLRQVVSVYATYPTSATPLATGFDTQTGTTDALISNLQVASGGWVIWGIVQGGTLGTFTVTWNGIDAVTENTDAQYESVSSMAAGNIQTTESDSTRDLTGAESTSGSKQMVAASWSP